MAIKKILVVGHGSIGIRHLTMINTVFDASVELGVLRKKKGGDFQFVKYFHDPSEALQWNPCFVVIASPSNTHASYIEMFSNCHILVEKPGVISRKELEKLKNINSTHMFKVGYNYRYHPQFEKINSYVQQNKIQSAVLIHNDYLPNWHPWEDYRFSDAARDGAGLTLCHGLDILLEVFGIESFKNLKVKKLKSKSLETEKETQHLGISKNNGTTIKWNIRVDSQAKTCFKLCLTNIAGDYQEFDLSDPLYPRNETFISQLMDIKKILDSDTSFNNSCEIKRIGEILTLCEE